MKPLVITGAVCATAIIVALILTGAFHHTSKPSCHPPKCYALAPTNP